MTEVTRYDKLIHGNIVYNKPQNINNIYFGSIKYNNNPLMIQTSRLYIKEIDIENKLIVLETNKDDFSFYDKLVELDDNNLEQTYQKSDEWFNKELPMDILENMYKRITKPFQKDTVPTIEFKLPYAKKVLQTRLYNKQNDLIGIDDLKPGCLVIAMIHINGLKFLKQNYYCDIILSQLKLIKDPIKQIGCLIDDDNTNNEINENQEKYDYENLDEEIIHKEKKILEEKNILEEKIIKLKDKIKIDQEELSKLEEMYMNLK